MPSATFRFNKIEGTLTGTVMEELLYTGEIVGSWWLTVAVLLIIGWLSHLTMKIATIFYCMLTFSIVISMLITAPIIIMLNRYISDEIYRGNYHAVAELLSGGIISSAIFSFFISFILLFSFSHLPANLKLLCSSLTASISLIWITGSVMSSIEKEHICVSGYILSGVIYLIPAFFIHPSLSLLIVIVTLFFLTTATFHWAYVLRGLSKGPIKPSLRFFSFKYIKQALGAFFLTLGAWADKIVFWFHPKTVISIDPLLRYSCYDYPFFIAFTIASVGQFLILRNQKQLRNAYKSYVSGLRYNYNFAYLYFTKLGLIREWWKSIYRLIYIYGAIVTIILLFIVIGILEMPWKNPFIFYYLIAGTLFFMFLFFNLLMFQYFLRENTYLFLSILFCGLNTAGTLLSIEKGPIFYGTGFLGAAFLSSLLSICLLSPILSRIEYITFKEVANVF